MGDRTTIGVGVLLAVYLLALWGGGRVLPRWYDRYKKAVPKPMRIAIICAPGTIIALFLGHLRNGN